MEILTDALVLVLGEHTDVTASLLTSLKRRLIISTAIITKIESVKDPHTQADHLYEWLQKFGKNEHLAGLKEALQKSNNWKALQILEDAEKELAPGAGQDSQNEVMQKSEIGNASQPALNSKVVQNAESELMATAQSPRLPPQPAVGKRKASIKSSEIGAALKHNVPILEEIKSFHDKFDVEVGHVFNALKILAIDQSTAGDYISKVVTTWRGSRYDEEATGKHFLEILVNAGYKTAAATLRNSGLADDTLIKY